MVTRANKVRASVFTTVGLVLLIVTFLVVAGTRVLQQKATYFVIFKESVAGLTEGTTVTFKGVPVGEVTGIRFTPHDIERILVVLEIAAQTPIKVNTCASTRTDRLTGGTVLELHSGTNPAKRLPPNKTIDAAPPILDELSYEIPQVIHCFQEVLTDLRAILSDSNRERISNILTQADRFFAEGPESLLEATRRIETLTSELTKTVPEVSATIAQFRQTLSEIGNSVTRGAEAIERTASYAEKTVKNSDLSGFSADLRAAAANLRVLTDGDNPDSIITNVEKTLDETRALVREVRTLMNTNGEAVSQTIDNLQQSTLVLQDFLKIVRSNPGILLAPPRPVD